MAFNARQILLIKVSADPERRTFLQDEANHGFGDDLDTRAGNRCNPEEKACERTDEDHTEGMLRVFILCSYYERGCTLGFARTFDHFHPPLQSPVAGKDAYVHAREYFPMAVKLYKAAECDSRGKAGLYYQWVARTLGHAIHLVENMGSPQHARAENHLPFALGHACYEPQL
jgi:hypothetical protein